jgi:hypothetical protein
MLVIVTRESKMNCAERAAVVNIPRRGRTVEFRNRIRFVTLSSLLEIGAMCQSFERMATTESISQKTILTRSLRYVADSSMKMSFEVRSSKFVFFMTRAYVMFLRIISGRGRALKFRL